jgi:hypothetical protein
MKFETTPTTLIGGVQTARPAAIECEAVSAVAAAWQEFRGG